MSAADGLDILTRLAVDLKVSGRSVDSERYDQLQHALAHLRHMLTGPLGRVLIEVYAERLEQDLKWGRQDHPWVEPGVHVHGYLASTWLGIPTAEDARKHVEYQSERGQLSFSAILVEEVAEAAECKDDAAARRELVQVAAVAIAAIEAIDRRAGSR